MVEICFHAMGSHMCAVVDNNSDDAAYMLAQVPGWFASWEACLSRFLDTSELSQLNRAGGKPFVASALLLDVVDVALQAAHMTEGLVTPTVLDALETAGYNRSFEQLTDVTIACSQDREYPISQNWCEIALDRGRHTITMPAHVRLDLGGIAKGWAADAAAQRLAVVGPTLVDAGGDIAVSGLRADGSPWAIAVADPFDTKQQRELLLLTHGGVATSGRDYRRWQHGGRWQHHLIDPRSGLPSSSDVVSATVVAPTAREAEVAAKIALLLGSDAGLFWLESHPSLAGLVVCDDHTLQRSSRLNGYCWRARQENYHD